MSDEQFLARWSRRKQEAKAGHAEPAAEDAAKAHAPAPSDCTATEPVPSVADLSSLPPIESIDAATDITAFLRKGIPQELSRVALRRAWSADPAIRDFVGLAESAWDFNDPNAVAGFGALDCSAEQVDALVRRIIAGDVVETADRLPDPPTEVAKEGARPTHAQTGFAHPSNSVNAITNPRTLDESAAELASNSAASQSEATSEETSLPRRTHGGALPR
ncbi:hypothetical protein ACVWWG_006307 [Bradyrhizobium sp. LB7.2]|uniref:DUF3306 domain-containing protein n=1 Tax=Bradyrhizobium sp. LB14.3 TaxID=3156328 RepID=UPI003397AAB4